MDYIVETKIKTTIEYYREGFIPPEKAAEKLEMSVDEFLEKYGQ
jgi:predicted HTH domain antitoxin